MRQLKVRSRSKPIEQEPLDAVAVADPPETPPRKTTPPKKKAALPKPSDLLAEEIAREKRLAIAREELLFRRHTLLVDGLDLLVDEYRLLETAVPKSATLGDYDYSERFGHFLNRENKRVETIINLQAASGTPIDQAAADKLAKQTAVTRDDQGPALEAEIRERQAKLESLSRAATDAQSAANARHAADENLRDVKLLPPFIRDELNATHRQHTDDFGKELLQLETRQISLTSLLALDVESPEGITSCKLHAQGQPRFGDDEMSRLKHVFTFTAEQGPSGVSHRFEKLRPGVWEDYCDERRQELNDVEGRIESIANGQQAAANREIKALRSFYCLK